MNEKKARPGRAGKAIAGAVSLLLLLTLGLWNVACGEKTALIGVVLPLTGVAKTYGDSIQQGIEIAVDELRANAAYPHEVEIETVDSGSDPERAKELTDELYGKGAVAVIGGVTTAEAKSMVPIADRFDRLLLSPSASNPDLSGLSRNFYRVIPSDYLEANKMADFAARQLQVASVVVIAESQDYAKGIQTLLEEQFDLFGVEIMEVIEYPRNTADYSGLIERAVTLNPDAVYLAAYAEAIAEMVKELDAAGYEGKILTTQAFATPSAIEAAGQAATGVLLTKSVFEVDSEHAHIKTFVHAYEAKFGKQPDIYAAYGYDAMRVLLEAMRERSPNALEVLKGMRSIKDFPGVVGSIQFDERGDVKIFPRVYTIKDDLALYSYDAEVQRQKEEILRRREELERKRRELAERMKRIGGEG